MELPDADLEELLYEIPRATSAPPHLDAFSQSAATLLLQRSSPNTSAAVRNISGGRFFEPNLNNHLLAAASSEKKSNLDSTAISNAALRHGPAGFPPCALPKGTPPNHKLVSQNPPGGVRLHTSSGNGHDHIDQSVLRAAMSKLSLQRDDHHYAVPSLPENMNATTSPGNTRMGGEYSPLLKSASVEVIPVTSPSSASNLSMPHQSVSCFRSSTLESPHGSLLRCSPPQTRTSYSRNQLTNPLYPYATGAQNTAVTMDGRIVGQLQDLPQHDITSSTLSQQLLPNRNIPGPGMYMNKVVPCEEGLNSDAEVVAFVQQQQKLHLARAMAERLHGNSGFSVGVHDQVTSPVSLRTGSPGAVSSWDAQSAFSPNLNYCRHYSQGHCIQGSMCPLLHSPCGDQGESALFSPSDRIGVSSYSISQRDKNAKDGRLEELVFMFGRRHKDALKLGSSLNDRNGSSFQVDRMSQNGLLVVNDNATDSIQHLMKFMTLDDLEGRIYAVAKDQHGCRFLQKILDEANVEDLVKIFKEIREHIVELMIDPFGNYLVQKLLDICNEAQRTAIIGAVTQKNDLIDISVNIHGTRAVQKLIEMLQTPQQVSMIITSLKHGVVTLIKDLNGNHVVQRCLQRLSKDDNQFIFDAAASHCVEIASHRHGCCVLQRCVDFASEVQRRSLVSEIAMNSLVLSQDPFGNYVVQYILELGLPWTSTEVISRLEGSFSHLAMQKFSSNVVEKCLKVATDENKSRIVKELIGSSVLGQLLQDPYANYVIQSALQTTKGHLYTSLVEAIKPHVNVLRSSPYGKRILSRIQLRK